MRRAEERRNASVMINSSIRWSLAGNEVDCRMKASEPRTFSWISTKTSMSAKRRTTALVSGSPSPSAMAWASAGLELPAISLIEPFLADIEDASRWLLVTLFSIAGFSLQNGFRRARTYQAGCAAGNPDKAISWAKMPVAAGIWLMVGVAERRETRGSRRIGAGDRGAARAGGGRSRRRTVDHAGQAAEACLRDLAQHEVVGRAPGIAAGLAADLLAREAQRALLVAVIDVPHPGDHGLAADHLRRKIGTHAIGGRAFARHDREIAQPGLAVEHAHHAVEHGRWRTVDRFERN